MTETPNPHIVDADTLTGETPAIRHCVVALGSNVGNRLAALQGALDSLADTPEVGVTEVSPVYETEPVDAPAGSEPFFNAVILLDTTLPAQRLLDRAQAIESAFGRQRGDVRNAPRALDVDLILVGEDRAEDGSLVLPHPRAHERAFVLAPWADVDSKAVIPGVGPVSGLLQAMGTQGVTRRDDLVLSLS